MTLDQALESARRGDYESATDTLTALGGRTSDDPRVLDLLARIHAQQGEFGDADDCWSRVHSLDPGNTAATQGKRRIAALQAKRLRRSWWPVAFVVAAGVGVVGVLLPITPPAPQPPDLSGISRQLEALQAKANAEPPVAEVLRALNSPAYTVIRQGDSVLVTFTQALFGRDARLSTSGTTAVSQLASQLGPFTVSLVITGHTDGRSRNPVDLGFARAQSVAETLGKPATVRSAGATQLYPHTPASSRARNNTVTVVVTPDLK